MANLLAYANLIHVSCGHEVERAGELASEQLYTEAAVRLGRAMESALYAVAREVGLGVEDVEIEPIKKLRDMLWAVQVEILRRFDRSSAKSRMGDVAKLFAVAIADIFSDDDHHNGSPSDEPRRTSALIKELIAYSPDDTVKGQLGKASPVVATLQKARNAAAHAPTDGGTREYNKEEYLAMTEDLEKVLTAVASMIAAVRAAEATPGEAAETA